MALGIAGDARLPECPRPLTRRQQPLDAGGDEVAPGGFADELRHQGLSVHQSHDQRHDRRGGEQRVERSVVDLPRALGSSDTLRQLAYLAE